MECRPAVRCGRFGVLVVMLLTLAVSGGCTAALVTAAYLIKGNDVPAEFAGLKDKKVAVVCRPLVGLTYRDSGVAKDLGRRLSKLLAANVAKIHVIDQSRVEEWMDSNEWDEYAEVGKALKADMVIGVDLEQFSIYEGQTVFQGKAEASVQVADCATGKLAFERRIPPLVYPPNHVVSTQDRQEAEFRREFVTVLADHVGRYFYPHDGHADVAMDAQAMH
jgi:hypothetical protein